jgi:hypothetical protein
MTFFRVYTNNGFDNIITNKWGKETDSKLIEDLRKDKKFSNYMTYKYEVKKDQEEKSKTFSSTHNKKNLNLENSSRNLTSLKSVNATNAINTMNSPNFIPSNTLSAIHTRPQTSFLPHLSEESKLINTNTLRSHTETGIGVTRTRMQSAYPISSTQGNVTHSKTRTNTLFTHAYSSRNNKSQIKNKTKNLNTLESSNTGFLFNEYYEKFKNKVEIKDEQVNQLYQEVKVGPYATLCPSCNRRNLEFYDQLKPETAISVLNLFKQNKINKYKN